MQHHVHRSNAEHGHIEIEPVEHLALDVLPMRRFDQVAGIGDAKPLTARPTPRIGARGVRFVFDDTLERSEALSQPLHELHQKPTRATGRITDGPRQRFVFVSLEN